jgi:glycosyltransferase involved in cell wall biosynthesis
MFLTEGDTACSQLVSAPLKELHKLGEIEFSLVYEGDFRGRILRKMARHSDILIAFRGCSRRSIKTFKAAKAAGVTTVWSSVDDLLELVASNPVGGRYQKSHIRESMEWMIRSADCIWVFSPFMQRKYAKLRDNVHFTYSVGPFGSFSTTSVEESPHNPETIVRIGHIGDFTHRDEMLPLIDAIHLLSKKELPIKWQFHFAGYTPEELVGNPFVLSTPYIKGVDAFHQWLRNASWSIGIAPLRNTVFNACKSDNKFRTFGGLGIAGIYTKVPPYLDAIDDGETGLLVSHDAKLYADAMEKLMMDTELRRKISNRASEICKNRYCHDSVLASYRDFLEKAKLNQHTLSKAG